MAVTNNPNSLVADVLLTLFYSEGFAGSRVLVDGNLSLYNISLAVDIRALDGFATKVSLEATGYQGTYLVGDFTPTLNLTIESDVITRGVIFGDISIPNISAEGIITRSSNVEGDFIINRLVTLDGTNLTSTYLSFDNNIYVVDDITSFSILGDAYTAATVFNNNVIVLNLRTKAHSIYREATLDAYAITGELLFGSNKNKNISDAFLFGRSNDAIELTVWNDEEKSRLYVVDYKSGTQGNLKNKKRPLSKGLYGTNWKFKVAKNGSTTAEVRSVDLFVNELKRHT
jgi:hypothetical protein